MCVLLCYYNRCHGNVIKGFWALSDNIYDVCVVITVAVVMDFGPYDYVYLLL
jgi:hypothetical protein